MATLAEIIRQQIDYMRASRITVDTDSAYSTVSITDDEGNCIFLQNDEAGEFIEKRDEYYENAQLNLTEDEADLVVAYNYADALCAG